MLYDLAFRVGLRDCKRWYHELQPFNHIWIWFQQDEDFTNGNASSCRCYGRQCVTDGGVHVHPEPEMLLLDLWSDNGPNRRSYGAHPSHS